MVNRITEKGGARRCIAFLLPGKHIRINPSAIHTVRLLSRASYEVNFVVSCKPEWPLPVFDDPRIQVYRFASTRLGGLRLCRDIFFSLKACLGHPIYCVIGGDPNGLIAATVLSLFNRAPVVYYSFELLYLDRKSNLFHRLKKKVERWCHRRAVFTIIQDPARARLLLDENRVPDGEVAIVPNAPAGSAPQGLKRDYWRREFGIPLDRLILLHAGEIADHNCVLELARIAHTWPEDWVLIIHGYGEESYLRRVKQYVDAKRVILSQELVPYDQLDELIGAADIGIALYNRGFGLNYSHVGLASGKALQYLRCGLPIITSDLPTLRELVVDNRCGMVIKDVSQIKDMVFMIVAQYEEHSLRASQYYLKHGNFEQYFQDVLRRLSLLGHLYHL
jgi:glycosyltransferase involved in cell wall biosynthesis